MTTDETCIWKNNESEHEDDWQSDCGELWCLMDGTPEENGMNFCPFCGKKLVQVIREFDYCDD